MVLLKEIKEDGTESTLESDDNLSMDEMENDSSEESILGDSDPELESDDDLNEEASDFESDNDMEGEDVDEEEGASNSEESDEMDGDQNGDEASENENSGEEYEGDASMNEDQHDDDSEDEECPTLENGSSHFTNSINLNDEEMNVLEDDEEIQAYLAAGKLKPGVTYEADQNLEKEYPNCVPELKQKLKELKYRGAWLERLDVTCDEAPMAPEMQMQVREEKKMKSANKDVELQNPFKDMSVLKDDFERETMFQRHAQAAVLLAIPRLAALDVRTKRPEDFFGQMVKSDEHMQKIRKKLQEKLLGQQASEHAKKIRKLRKFGKKVQTEVMLSKAEKKREMMKKLKAYRAGQISQLDFMEDDTMGDTAGENGGVFSSSRKKEARNQNRHKSKEALNEIIDSDGPDRSAFRSRGGRGGPRGGRGGPVGGRGGSRGGRGGPRGGRGGPRGGRGGPRGGRGGSRGGRGGSGGGRGGPSGGRGGGGKFRGSSKGAAKRPGKGRRKSNN